MTIRSKIFALVGALLLLMGASQTLSLFLQGEATEEIDAISQYHLPITAAVAEIDVKTFEYELNVLRLLQSQQRGTAEIEAAEKRQSQIAADVELQFQRAAELLKKGVDDDQNDVSDRVILARLQAKVDSLHRSVAPFVKVGEDVLQACSEGDFQGASQVRAGFREFEEAFGTDLAEIRRGLESLTESSTIEVHQQQVWLFRVSILLMLAAVLIGVGISLWLANRLTQDLRQLLGGAVAVQQGDLSKELPIRGKDELARLTEAFNAMIEQLRTKKRIMDTFGQYLDPRIVQQLVGPNEANPEVADRRVVTVFFSDVAGFTGIGEQLTAAALANLLNHYFSVVSEAILDHHGVIDKYIGDGVMAFWAPPFSRGDSHASDACLAALAQQEALHAFRKSLGEVVGLRRDVPEFKVRMGLATGEVLVGTLGSPKSKSYTVIGDVVNLASRLEGVNKVFGTTIIASEETIRLARSSLETRELDLLTVVGKSEPIRIHEILGPSGALPPEMERLRQAFETALQAYRAADWDEADKRFATCLEIKPGDGPSAVFLQRVQTLRESPPEDWDGVWHLNEK